MGLLSWALHKVHPRVGLSFMLTKLCLKLRQAGLRPVRLADKIGSFLLDMRSGRLGLALLATRVAVNTQVTEGRVLATLTILGDPEVIKAYGLSPQDITVSVKMMEGLEEKNAQQLAACIFMEHMLSKRAVNSDIAMRYNMAGGQFDAFRCLQEYFSSPRSLDFRLEVKRSQERQIFNKERIDELAMKVWKEITHRSRNEAIDFILL